jgi:hypothetical protein
MRPAYVTVRLAHDGEFPSPSPRSIGEAMSLELTDRKCKLEGADAPELRDAIVEFARANLLSDLDKLTGYSSREMGIETPLKSTGCDHPPHRDGMFTEILVTPRTGLGELQLWQRELTNGQCTWGADIDYCVHVLRDASGTTVVLEKHGGMIGRVTHAAVTQVASD